MKLLAVNQTEQKCIADNKVSDDNMHAIIGKWVNGVQVTSLSDSGHGDFNATISII